MNKLIVLVLLPYNSVYAESKSCVISPDEAELGSTEVEGVEHRP